MSDRVEYFGASLGREERATLPAAELGMAGHYSLDLLVEASAPEALRSLARYLGISVTEAMAMQETGMLGAAIEARNAVKAAERRSRCDCGCQSPVLSARAQLRARWRPGYADAI